MSTQTFFATPEREEKEEIAFQVSLVNNNPVVSGLLQSIGGILAVVNDKRQVVAFNHTFMELLGIENPEQQMGLRPGQILRCEVANAEPHGCGTTKQCRTCGAAIAMVTSLAENRPVERKCVVTARRGDRAIDIVLCVRAHPININAQRFLLLFIQDITRQHQQAALERTFFHDVSNLMSMLLGASELLIDEHSPELARTVYTAALRLKQEINIQRYLRETEQNTYKPMWHDVSCREILQEIEPFFENHPVAANKTLSINWDQSERKIKTDISLVLRILCNMITNALEASQENGIVTVKIVPGKSNISFEVWNQGYIAADVQQRLFQRNFTTKDQSGRGIGTFSMKLLGEEILGGKVDYSTSINDGTAFRFTLPVDKHI